MKHLLATALLLLLASGCVRRLQDVRVVAPSRGAGVELEITTSPRATTVPAAASSPSAPSIRIARRPPVARYRIDWDFIRSVEGRPRARGYVPSSKGRPLDRSGVTVGTGFDLGQHDASDLRRLGLHPRLIAVLEPYLRLRGADAQAALRTWPLELGPLEVAAIDRAKSLDTARKIERRFDSAHAPHVPPFSGLSPAQQTVLFSLATQYGTRLDRKTPAFWELAVSGRFDQAVRELRHFGDGYRTRRNREADLLVEEQARWSGQRIDSPTP